MSKKREKPSKAQEALREWVSRKEKPTALPPLPFEIAGTDILKTDISPLQIPAERAAAEKRRSKNIQTFGKARPESAAV